MATLTVYKLPSNYDGERQTATYDPPFPLNEGTTTTYREVSKSGHVSSITVKVFQTYFEATRFQVAEPDGSIDYVWEGLTKVDVNVGWSSFFANYMAGDDLIRPASSMRTAGQAGNDTLQSSAGIDVFDGGDGIDAIRYPLSYTEYMVSKLPFGDLYVTDKQGVTDLGISVERLIFPDKVMTDKDYLFVPGATQELQGSVQSVYRFYNTRDKSFFYTPSKEERDMIVRESTDASFNPGNGLWPYFFQGTTFEEAHTFADKSPVYRFYNKETGHHFFTTSAAEREIVIKESTDPNYGAPGLWPFIDEGVGFYAYSAKSHEQLIPVFRFYSPSLNRHFFTADATEVLSIILTGVWDDEGVGFFAEAPGPG